MLLRNHSPGYALSPVNRTDRTCRASGTYGSEQCIHEPIRLLRLHETLTFNDTHRKLRYHGEVLLQRLADDCAESVIVLHRPYLPHSSQSLKGFVIQLIYVGHVWVGHDHIGQCLHVSQSVREP